MSRLALFFLGSPRIERDGAAVHISRHKAVALLAYLAVTGQSHRRDALAALFWPECDQTQARAGLRRILAALKKALGEGWLDVSGEEVGLCREAGIWLDVGILRDRLAVCREHGHPPAEACPACLPLLAEAVTLYRGGFLAGFTLRDSPGFDEWQFFEAQSLHDELASTLERLVQGYSTLGDLEQAIVYARRWLALDPLHEPAHCCLIDCYARAGQRAAALRQYAECERILREEVGVPPSAETAELYQRIQERKEPLVPPDGAVVAAPPRGYRKHNLPAQVTPFIGRRAVLAEIAARLEEPGCRLLTLVGPGGSGKTRLALEAAARQIERFAQGVFLVSLAPLQSVEAIVPTIAQAIGFSFSREGDPRRQLVDWLGPRNMLLVLDNLEHLLACPEPDRGTCVDIVTGILQEAPEVKVLATSRARLGVQGECLFPVSGMEIPDEQAVEAIKYGAMQLFLTGARRTHPRFEPTPDDIAQMIRICRLVEGLPLGILLAAAWMEMLTPAEIVAEMESQIPGRGLDFLETDWHDVPDRQRSMRAVFNHSWRLLSQREQEILAGLSVFCGGFTRQAAQAITVASLRELMALIDKSMLQRAPAPLLLPVEAAEPPLALEADRSHRTMSRWAIGAAFRMTGAASLGAEGRYEVHQVLRQYATEKLADLSDGGREVHDRHCAHYIGALQQWAAELKDARQQAALAQIETDLENIHAAWNWAVEQGQVERLGCALEGLGLFYDWRVRYGEAEATFRVAANRLAAEGSEWTQPTASRALVRARALGWQSRFCRQLGHTPHARDLLRQATDLLDSAAAAGLDIRPDRAFLLLAAGEIAYWSGNRQEAHEAFAQSLALNRVLEDRWGTACALCALGMADQGLGLYEQARQLHRESLAIRRILGDQRGVADTLLWLAFTLQEQGELEEAERLERESIGISRALGDQDTVARGLFCLAFTLALQGRYAEARPVAEECVAMHSSSERSAGARQVYQMDNVLAVLGAVEMSLGRYEQARAWMQTGLAHNREMDDRWGTGYALLMLGELALAEGKCAEAIRWLEESAAVFREGRQRGAETSALALLGCAAQLLGDSCQAGQCLCEALHTLAEIRSFAWLAPVLPAAALALAGQGRVERAVEVYALASRYPFVSNARWIEDAAGQRIAAAAAVLPPEAIAAAQERGRARDLWATVEELSVEFAMMRG